MADLRIVPPEPDEYAVKRAKIEEGWRKTRLVRVGIQVGRSGWTWESAPPTAARALSEVREAYAARESILLAGPQGTGKTGLAIGAVRAALDEGRSAQFAVLPLLLVDLNDTYRETSRTPRGELLRSYFGADSPDLLAVDDLGAELRETDAVKADVWLMLEMRQAAGKQTVITTNLGPPELETRYDRRSYSRLTSYRIIVVDGEDQRRRK